LPIVSMPSRSRARRNPESALPSGRGYHLTRRSFRRTDGRQRSNGEAPRASATCKVAPDVDRCPLPARDPSPPSRPTCGPSRRLLVLALQKQFDALSDERGRVRVLRVRDDLPHPVPRRLIQAEGDDSRLSCHSLSSFPWGRDRPVQGDRRLNPIRPSTVLFNGPLGTTGGWTLIRCEFFAGLNPLRTSSNSRKVR
jgi:hypothetical protein